MSFSKATAIEKPIDGRVYDFDFFYNFTKYLHGKYRYNSFVIFSPKSKTRFRANFVNLRPIEQALMEDFNVPIIVWGMERNVKLRNNIGLNNLVFVQFSNLNDPILDVVDSTLEGLHFISILFFYLAESHSPPSKSEIEAFFEWCWRKNMLNVALIFKLVTQFQDKGNNTYYNVRSQIFNYTPFPKFTVYNITKDVENGEVNFIVDRLKDVKRYEFKTPMITNLPYAFVLNKTKNCKYVGNCRSILSGITGRLYNEYINRINGKVQIQNVEISNSEQFTDIFVFGAAKKAVHIGLAPVSTSMNFYNATEGSYPIIQSNVCIIVPLSSHMHTGHYYWCTFQQKVWLMILLTFLTLLLLEVGNSYKFGLLTGNALISWSAAIFMAIRICVGQISIASLLQQHKKLHRLFYWLMLMMTFILAQTYTASMTSMLTSGLVHKPINTVKDFLATDLELMISASEFELFFKTKMLPIALLPRLRIVRNTYLNQHRRFLNTSYAYIFRAEHWQMGNYQQKRLRRPLFRVPSRELCTSKFYIQIPLQWDSPFLQDLNLFFIRTQESGLALKWQEMTNWEAQQMKLIDLKKPNETSWRPLTVHDFTASKNFFQRLNEFYILIFLLEVFWYHCCLRTGRKRLKKRLRNAWRQLLRKIKFI